MIRIDIPGWKDLHLEDLVLDVNGTIARDGVVPPAIREKIFELANSLSVYLISADTYGTLEKQAKHLAAELVRITSPKEMEAKGDFIRQLGEKDAVAIGNGANDVSMLKEAALSIVVLGREGAAAKAIEVADIVVESAEDALDLLLKPVRLKASLRR